MRRRFNRGAVRRLGARRTKLRMGWRMPVIFLLLILAAAGIGLWLNWWADGAEQRHQQTLVHDPAGR